MEAKEQYMREVFAKMQHAKKGMEGLTPDQLKAIEQAITALTEALDYCTEVFDLRLSDVDKLQCALHKLRHNFETEPTSYQEELFAEYGIGEATE